MIKNNEENAKTIYNNVEMKKNKTKQSKDSLEKRFNHQNYIYCNSFNFF